MNPNLWNIKEILSIPPGNSGAKITNRIGVTNGHSSLTDSQFVCGSQFWPENSQGMSQEMSFSSRTSQQSSQEGTEPKISSNYHTKPFLFGEGRDKAVQNVQKAISILDKFEEDKKKAKEKSESDLLANECLYFRETLNNMKQSVTDTEKNTDECKTILKGFDKFATTLQQNLSSLHHDIAQQFEIMLNKVSSQTQELTKMEERLLKTGEASTEMGSHVQALQKNLESLREEQGREQNMLQEALSLLSTLVSKHSTQPDPVRVTDSAVQTSPERVYPFYSLQQNSRPEHSQVTLCQPEHSQVTLCQPEHSQVTLCQPEHSQVTLCQPEHSQVTLCQPEHSQVTLCQPEHSQVTLCQSEHSQVTLCQSEHSQVTLCQPEHSQVTLCQPEHSQLAVTPPDHWDSCITTESRAALRGRKRNRRRPLVLPVAQWNNSICDENTQPQTRHTKQEVATPLKQLHPKQEVATPLKQLHPKQEVATPLKQLHSVNRMATPKPHPQIGYNRESRSNKSTGGHVTPFNLWSQDSGSSVCSTGTEPSSERLSTGPKIRITNNTKGYWQLFDTSYDSDSFPVEE